MGFSHCHRFQLAVLFAELASNLETRHFRDLALGTRHFRSNPHHHRKTGHDINWDSATCLTHSTDKDQRLTLESWFTNLQPNPLNRSRKLPAAYERLLQSEYRTADENTD